MSKVSASALGRILVCPASAELEHTENRSPRAKEAASRGTRIHHFLEMANKTPSLDQLLTTLDEDIYGTCACIDLPEVVPIGSLCEVAFAYDVMSRSVRLIGFSVDRNYGELADTEIAGTADLILDNYDPEEDN